MTYDNNVAIVRINEIEACMRKQLAPTLKKFEIDNKDESLMMEMSRWNL